MTKVSILGCGWFGLPLAQALVRDGYTVYGSTTTSDKLEDISANGIIPFLVDLARNIMPDDFMATDILIVNVPPRLKTAGAGEYLRQMNIVGAMTRLSTVKKIIFISSTSVYADLNRIVNEEDADVSSPILQAERIFQLNMKASAGIFRFAGLVGPRRHPGKFLSGKINGGATTPVNIIHLDDCVQIVRKSLKAGINEDFILNACADLHPTKREFYSKMADLLSLPEPQFNDQNSDYKIVDNSRLKRYLSYEFIYPDPMQMEF
jgi:nucleoside-diphosphate-sugar epimerase